MRSITEMKFGSEWTPKLVDVMRDHPWPDSAFSMNDPTAVCRICGRAEASINHPVGTNSESHDFVPCLPWTDAQIASAKSEWRQRMTNLPTTEALNAWDSIHTEKLSRLYRLLAVCKINTDEDIEQLGCTGCAALGLSIDDIQFLRLGLAGGGVGLPCFVPPNRYCLAHGVSGGLQEGQKPLYIEGVEKVARPLTPDEIAHDKLVAAARKSEREHGAHSMLHGHTLPAGWEEVAGGTMEGAEIDPSSSGPMSAMPRAGAAEFLENVDAIREEGGIDDIVAAGRMGEHFDKTEVTESNSVAIPAWKCDEHTKTNWLCRYCIAQAIVEGDLTPTLRFAGPPGGGIGIIKAEAIDAKLDELSQAGSVDHAEVYARVASFTRKLARD